MIRLIIGNLITIAYIFVIMQASEHIHADREVRRKILHILLGGWWILCVMLFDKWYQAIITPVIFIIINSLMLLHSRSDNALKGLIREGEKPVGTIVYPIGMAWDVLISYLCTDNLMLGSVGMIILSFGDAAAALTGIYHPWHKIRVWGKDKTLSGGLAMFMASFVSILVYLCILSGDFSIDNLLYSVILALIGAVTEFITPLGLDNLTIPVVTSLVYLWIH